MNFKRSLFLAALFVLFAFHHSVLAQDAKYKRRVSLAVTEGEPVSGYLIKSDADNMEVETPDGKRVIVPLDNVTLIIVSRKPEVAKETPVAPANPDGNLSQQESEAQQPSQAEPSPTPSSTGGPVQVRGYYRKDGTYVKPHTRRAPRRRN